MLYYIYIYVVIYILYHIYIYIKCHSLHILDVFPTLGPPVSADSWPVSETPRPPWQRRQRRRLEE